MNYFAHAMHFLDRPYLAVASGVPDMLMVVDRDVRVRSKHVAAFVDHDDPVQADVARGILQHFRDDLRFHGTRAFVELNLGLAAAIREALDGDAGPRPRFLAHLLVEVLLDAALIAERPERLEAYYRALAVVDADAVQTALNQMAPRPSRHLAEMIRAVARERFLWDYLEDGTLMVRLNQVLRRVGLETVPPEFQSQLGSMRRQVAARQEELLEGIPV
ncbi:MAG TPA: hypothetical protein VJL29_14680 [Thermoguttaceae bacterium]|nr:hypothetical protein [Thermoguttaceae bacterium]